MFGKRELQLVETRELALHHDPEIIWKAFLIADSTGHLPPIHEVAGDGYPMTYVEDIATIRAQAYFQYSHLVGEQDD